MLKKLIILMLVFISTVAICAASVLMVISDLCWNQELKLMNKETVK